jgi:hypothetical protein
MQKRQGFLFQCEQTVMLVRVGCKKEGDVNRQACTVVI